MKAFVCRFHVIFRLKYLRYLRRNCYFHICINFEDILLPFCDRKASKPNATCERVSDALTSLAAALTRWSDAFTPLFSNAALLIMAAAVASAARARLWAEDRNDRCGGGLRRPLSTVWRRRGHDPPAGVERQRYVIVHPHLTHRGPRRSLPIIDHVPRSAYVRAHRAHHVCCQCP